MKRRKFIAVLGGAAAWPLTARAQQPERMRRVGVLITATERDPETQRYIKAFGQGLQESGWARGRNVQIEYRWGGMNHDRIRVFAAELVMLKPDVILAHTAVVVTALQQETRTVPIVFMQIIDPVESGFVVSLARPGGNLTGFIPFEFSIATKWLEILKQIAPDVRHVTTFLNPAHPHQFRLLREIETVAPAAGVLLSVAGVSNGADIERAVNAIRSESNGGLIVVPSPVTVGLRELIITLAARYRIPAIYAYRHFVADGGLISYGPHFVNQYRQAAGYVDHILRGEKPADLPVQAPTKYELVINMKTAKALGLDAPPVLLARADKLIE